MQHVPQGSNLRFVFFMGMMGVLEQERHALFVEEASYHDLALLPRTIDKVHARKANFHALYRIYSRGKLNFRSTYMAGGLYVMSSDLVTWIANNSDVAASTVHFAYEDWNAGWWAAMARTALYGKLSEKPDYSSDKDIKVWGANDVQASTRNEWYNLDWPFLDVREISVDANLGNPPLSTIVAHRIKNQSRFQWMHDYFMNVSFTQRHMCAKLSQPTATCKAMMKGQGWTSDLPSFMAHLYDFHPIGPSIAHHTAFIHQWAANRVGRLNIGLRAPVTFKLSVPLVPDICTWPGLSRRAVLSQQYLPAVHSQQSAVHSQQSAVHPRQQLQ
eukprot:gene19413-26070_t